MYGGHKLYIKRQGIMHTKMLSISHQLFPSIWLAQVVYNDKLGRSGVYWSWNKENGEFENELSEESSDQAKAKKLWDISMKLVGLQWMWELWKSIDWFWEKLKWSTTQKNRQKYQFILLSRGFLILNLIDFSCSRTVFWNVKFDGLGPNLIVLST